MFVNFVMKKRVFGKKLGRERDTRRALIRGLVVSLIEHGKIETTQAKAKAMTSEIDGLVNLAKDGSTASLRRLHSELGNNGTAVKKLVQIAPKMSARNSGYSRQIRLGTRRGDFASMTRIEWVDDVSDKKKEKNDKEQDKSEKKQVKSDKKQKAKSLPAKTEDKEKSVSKK